MSFREKKLFGYFLLPMAFTIVFQSCNTIHDTEIKSACEKNRSNDFVVKWETDPEIEGTVKIYSSQNAESFDLKVQPLVTSAINTGYIAIHADKAASDTPRTYFYLLFNKEFSSVAAERLVSTDKIYNMRDIGGYTTNDDRQVKWGKIYRANILKKISKEDVNTIRRLGITTIIDLRPKNDNTTDLHGIAQKEIRIPLDCEDVSLYREIIEGKIGRGKVKQRLEKIDLSLVENNKSGIRTLFTILKNKDNYPVLLLGPSEKSRVEMATVLILSALNVSEDQISQEYLSSNDYIGYKDLLVNVENYPAGIQEALTTYLRANDEVINSFFSTMDGKYGSVRNFLKQKIGLNDKEGEEIKDLMIYKEMKK